MSNQKLDILLLSKYSRLGASSRLRTMQYLPGLAEAGINVEIQSLFDDAYLQRLYAKKGRKPLHIMSLYLKRLFSLISMRRVDVVWLEYEMFPYFPAWFESWIRFRGISIVVDYDDAVFHNYDLSANQWVRQLLRHKIDDVMKTANVVVAGNSYLRDRAVHAGAQHVYVVPTVIDLARYQPLSERAAKHQLTVGWIGSPATQSYLTAIASVLPEVLNRYNARLMLIGASTEIQAQLPGCEVVICPWSESTEVEHIRSFDIGIMPLPDGPWERGKCGYKLVQYMACGIPVIASAVGANVEIVKSSESGYLAASPEEWAQSLELLLTDEALRKRFGLSGRLAVEQRFSVQAQTPKLIDIFNSVKRNSAA